MPLLPALLVAGVFSATPPDASAIDRLAWLEGCWSRTRGQSVTEEHWMAPRGGTILGMSRTVRDGRTVEYEFVQIRFEGDALVYEARPSGQPMAIFPLKTLADDAVTFENPTHDFPQRIIYRRTPEGIAARIEGTLKGTPRGVDFPFSRCAD